ncbi:MAG: response regulator transcription factor [Kangiellaceae bacterium]|nr:response regulator transcription factor [Kangiellaceae bacterium]
MNPISIIIAEDHAILREGLISLLATSPEFDVIAEAEDGSSAIKLARKLNPDVILMDLNMPVINGTEAIRTILKTNPKIKIIALTGHRSEEYVRVTLEAGAVGYVLKDDTHHELLIAINKVLDGNTYLSPGVGGNVTSGSITSDDTRDELLTAIDNVLNGDTYFSQRVDDKVINRPLQPEYLAGMSDYSWTQLTKREKEITKLIAEGKKNREIAGFLSLSIKTVDKHRSNLMKKLDLHNVSELTKFAIENKIIL